RSDSSAVVSPPTRRNVEKRPGLREAQSRSFPRAGPRSPALVRRQGDPSPRRNAVDRCRVVLVRPELSANVGATARVMRNFGAREPVLAPPTAAAHARPARQMPPHREEILDACRVVPDLGAAVADCVLVAGTSARTGGLFRRQSVGTPDEVMPHLVAALPAGP